MNEGEGATDDADDDDAEWWWMSCRRSVDGRRCSSKLRLTHSITENPLLARHKRDATTLSTCYHQRHSLTPSDAGGRPHSTCSGGSWTRSLAHAAGAPASYGLPPAVSELVLADYVAAAAPWLSSDAGVHYECCSNVNAISAIPSDNLLASSLHDESTPPDDSLSLTAPPPPVHVCITSQRLDSAHNKATSECNQIRTAYFSD